MRFGFVLYVAFILYGSFFPFHFAADPAVLRGRLEAVVVLPWDPHGTRIFSIPDLVSNILLGVPFGLLLVVGHTGGATLPARLTRVLILDLLLAGAIEIGQLFVPGRTTSLLDIGGQMLGSLGGAIGGDLLLRSFRGPLRFRVLELVRGRADVGPLGLLIGVLVASALYPYAPTLDVSTIWQNARAASLIPLGYPPGRSWHAIVVERVLPYALLTALLSTVLRLGPPTGLGVAVVALGTVLAAGLELGKLFIVGGSPNADHVLWAVAGLVVGRLALPAIRWIRRHPLHGRVYVIAATALLTYEELAPFDVVWSLGHLQHRAAFIEWAPFAAYYSADPQSALFDAGKNLMLGGLLGAALCAADRGRVLTITLVLGILLEAAQLITASRHASITDAILLAGGAAAGRLAYQRYCGLTGSSPGHESEVLDSRSHSEGWRKTQLRDG